MAYAGEDHERDLLRVPLARRIKRLHGVESGVPYFDPWDTGSDPKELGAIG
jgi:hypothetical protein